MCCCYALVLLAPPGLPIVRSYLTRQGTGGREGLRRGTDNGTTATILELGHYDILEHNSITWLVDASEKDILSLLDSSKFFETSRLDEEKWIVTTNLRVLVELARAKNPPPLSRELVATLITAAPNIASTLAATVKS